jgi:malonyl-CoA O-methyltransferase
LPATWETITAMAWAPEAGTPLREGDFDVASIPLSHIPIRRRG